MAESAPGSSRHGEAGVEGENHSSYPSGERSGDERQGGTEALPRVKSVLFHAIMWAMVALPFLAAVVLFSVSLIAYDILQHPERHQSTRRVWDVIATDLYYLYEANLWQIRRTACSTTTNYCISRRAAVTSSIRNFQPTLPSRKMAGWPTQLSYLRPDGRCFLWGLRHDGMGSEQR